MDRWPADPVEPIAKLSLPGLALAWEIRLLTSVTGRFLLTAMASGALATSATGAKSLTTLNGGDFIVIGVVVTVEGLNSKV